MKKARPRLFSYSMFVRVRISVIFVLLCPLSATAASQTPSDVVAGGNLGSGYAQMLNITASPDISAAHYDIDNQMTIDVMRLPYEWDPFAHISDTSLRWRVVGGYFVSEAELNTDVPSLGAGTVDAKWTAYSLTTGLLARTPLGDGFELSYALDAGVARLKSQANYSGASTVLQPYLDGLLFNWQTNATLVTPNAGLEWQTVSTSHRIDVLAHVAWSWIDSFDEPDPVLVFNETAGVYSIRAEYASPTGMQLLDRSLDWVLTAGNAGFFGYNRNAFFSSIWEIGFGFELPTSNESDSATRLRVGAGYLKGDNVTGWTVNFGLRY